MILGLEIAGAWIVLDVLLVLCWGRIAHNLRHQ